MQLYCVAWFQLVKDGAMPFKPNPRRLKRGHTIAISAAEWEFAAELGRNQETPVSPSTVLRRGVFLYLSEQARKIRAMQQRQRGI
jgi:hypothetical protein